MLKYGQFIGKGYDCGGLFRFSLANFCNKLLNYSCGNVNDDASVWHSRLCHVNFGLMSRLSSMCLIPNIIIAKCKDRWPKRGGELGLFRISKII